MDDFDKAIAEYLGAPNPVPLPQQIADAQKIDLSAQQTSVIHAVEAGENILVTGPAGTGKSTLLKAMRDKYGARLPLAASTGIAAVGIGGVTIHSWAGLGLGEGKAATMARNIRDNNAKAYSNITGFNRIAIDEISMISAGLFTKIEEIFRILRKVERPFGGMQLIMFGDFLQLPPVIKAKDESEKDGHLKFAFESPAWAAAKIKTVVLSTIFRQADARFAQALNDVRVGKVTPIVSELLNSRYKAKDPNPEIEPVTVHTHNGDVEMINDGKLAQIQADPVVFTAVDTGREGAVKLLQKNCLAPTILTLKIGAIVMLLHNLDTDSGLANGSVGRVHGFSQDKRRPIVKFNNGETRELEQWEWTINDNGKKVASRFQIPLRLAWAITAHKSQGMTLDKIRVFLAKCFEDGQAYVALSRARTLEGLFIESGTKKNIHANDLAIEFYEKTDKIAADGI